MIPRDVKLFIEGYPNAWETNDANPNLRFYSNDMKCRPDGLLIEEILTRWQGKYKELESKHGYIQWVFPIPEQGVNFHARPLTRFELSEMNTSSKILERAQRSYELMLDFYGMRLLDRETGLVDRKEDDWEVRYQNLTQSFHNYLRITRILKFMSLMSYPQYAAPFVLHVLSEQSQHGLLNSSALRNSLDKWWANCNRDEAERQSVQDIIKRVRTAENTSKDGTKWIFTREMYETMVAARIEGRGLVLDES